MRGLPLLNERTAALETCGYCPKLCRAVCPVSTAEASETVTPWGKMSLAWLAARGVVPTDEEHARTAWACTGCLRCKQRCDHDNPVADTLFDARADYRLRGVAPEASERVVREQPERERALVSGHDELAMLDEVDDSADVAVLVGCGYVLDAPSEAADAVVAVSRLVSARVRLVRACCGERLLHAGDREGYRVQQQRLRAELGAAKRFVAVDPGCARASAEHEPTTLAALAASELGKLRPGAAGLHDGAVRWHDPCQLGRGLRQYDEPRAVLARVLRRPPDEFERRREEAECSGAGALLPQTMPDAAERITQHRLADHERSGGGTVVTGCAGSLRRFRASGAHVVDLATVLRRSL